MLETLLNGIGAYKLYRRMLKDQISGREMPKHVGIILDGNRRWAKSKGQEPWDGHLAGESTIKKCLQWCLDLNIKTVTIYAFSTENFNRDKREVDELMRIYEAAFKEFMESGELRKNRVRFNVLGRTSLLPESLQGLIAQLEETTKDYDGFYVNVALAYGGRAEIVDAVREVAEMVKAGEIAPQSIDEKLIAEHLYTAHLPQQDPDLIIRTANESRLSNFLLWQSAYTEFFIVDVYWPDFREIDLWRVVRSYQNRHRRFGK